MIQVTLKDGSLKEYYDRVSIKEVAENVSAGLARAALVGEVNGVVKDLSYKLETDCKLNILTFENEEGKRAYRHTTSHIMAQAVKRLYPHVKLAIGPAIANGFYYDFDVDKAFSLEDLKMIEQEMENIIKADFALERFTLPKAEAVKFMEDKDEPYKVELIRDLPEGEEMSFYKQDEFVDLCAGPHLSSTGKVKAFKLTQTSGAYWRGNEKNKMLQRIYGTAFPKKSDLDEYIVSLEEAKKRDQ
jgi:threonyl-tRNA synthetase